MELSARLAALRRAGVEHLACGREAPDLLARAFPGQAPGPPATDRHDVDIATGRAADAVVLADEGQPLAVGRQRRLALVARMRGQALGRATAGGDPPQIAFGDEHELLAAQRRLAVVALD